MDPQAALHLPSRDPYGETVRRRLYIGAVVCGMALLLFGVVMQRTLNLPEPYLQYVAPSLLGLSALNLWWLLSGRALIVAEVASVVVLAAASMAHIVLVSLGAAALPGAYPNSGPYWAVISVCVLAFLALPPRRATPFNLTYLSFCLLLPWLLPTTYAASSASGLVRVQLNALLVFLLVWGLSWFRTQYASQTQSQELLRRMAFTDALTGLPNRHAVYPAVEALLRDAAQGQAGSLFLIDLDHFKRINDRHGHGVGDEVLVAAAQVLRNCATEKGSPPPTVGRWGGEEFIVVMPGTPPERAGVRAERLLAEFRAWNWPQHLGVTASIGSSSVRVGEDFSGLLARADAALYAAKSSGRDRAVVRGEAELEESALC
ncbi:GGDEF domain-containing protein [Deinococcus marmoris]|uniref:Diguanylate cyclase/phosphodiesterase (GGDEF & EAL domains) with PAS/PAC sensor(S) n=1 Tax=Deinococcus marmoris TaxID=249408 RepID=A0A1U7P0W1_9DEIO|nr:GGDEF domain-containing protein [Deinococcus marmoris]OLV18811.1 diguanylate cyclase/phosphodiesterase (GGDEF & EAL domains) with PAS/PAC sensor(s) [Deinococcus marmoris]